MKTIISMLATIIIVCLPTLGFSDPATINNDLSVSESIAVRSWQTYNITKTYSMQNFDDGINFPNINYKITVIEDSPDIVNVTSMSLHVIKTNNGVTEIDYFKTITSGDPFTYTTSAEAGIVWSYSFLFTYEVPNTAALSQTQLVKFEIRKQNLFIWDWQSTFYYYLNTTCPASWNFSTGTLSSGDHEVSNYLTASVSVFPNGGITELDGGSSVTLLPGFSSNLSGGGAILIINDGCGGAYRLFNPSANITNTDTETVGNYKNDNISIYPNPTNDLISIIIPNAISGEKIKVETKDLNGRVLFSEERTHNENSQLDLKDLKPGLYFISISGSNLNYNQKIIKQ